MPFLNYKPCHTPLTFRYPNNKEWPHKAHIPYLTCIGLNTQSSLFFFPQNIFFSFHLCNNFEETIYNKAVLFRISVSLRQGYVMSTWTHPLLGRWKHKENIHYNLDVNICRQYNSITENIKYGWSIGAQLKWINLQPYIGDYFSMWPLHPW